MADTTVAPKKSFFSVLKTTVQEWRADDAPYMAAALAYYSFLSLAPLLVIALAVVAIIYGDEAARGELVVQLQKFMGPQAAQAIQDLLTKVHMSGKGTLATILSIGALLASATGLVGHLKKSLNQMWNVEEKPGRGIMGFITDRAIALGMILGIGFLLLLSVAASTIVSGMAGWISQNLITIPPIMLRLLELLLSLGVVTILFAMIYKFLPDVKIEWKSLWVGAVVTAVLFVIGKYLIGLYLGRGSVTSAYGAAGSLVLLLIWIYYSSLIFFLGAEFTQVWAKFRGVPVQPKDHAIAADSPEALARRPKLVKAVTCDTPSAEGTEATASGSPKALPQTAANAPRKEPRNVTVTMPAAAASPAPRRGSVLGGVFSFLTVRLAHRILGGKKRPS